MKLSSEEFNRLMSVDTDILIVDNNERILLDRAILLGFKNVILLSTDFTYVKTFQSLNLDLNNIKIYFGILIQNPNDLNKAKDFDFTFAYAERVFFESKVDFIIDLEYSEKKDSFHYKNTSFNHVHAKFSKEHNHTLLFSFNSLIENPKILGRILYNSNIVNKYHINFKVFNLSKKFENIRSRTILDSLESILKK